MSADTIILCIIYLLGGVGVFMAGMKFMSSGLERIAGQGMQRILAKISNNRFIGFGIGAIITAIIQSSSGTTVMTIGFVNAGVMSLFQAISIIIGANIGTTVTGFLTALSTFSITDFFFCFAAIGIFIKLFAKKDKSQSIGDILLGLGFIFIGLSLMSSGFKGEGMTEGIKTMFTSISFPFLLLLVGTLITAIIQSSSAVTGIVIVLAASDALPLEYSFYIILGANIGTCVTGLLASIGAFPNAKRVALAQVLFNVIGVMIFFPITWVFESQIAYFLGLLSPNKISFQIAFYHLFFNTLTAIMVLPFVKHLVKLTTFLIKDTKTKDEFRLAFIDTRIIQMPHVALAQIQKEILRMLSMAKDNLVISMDSLINKRANDKSDFKERENYINYLNKSIASILIELSSVSSMKEEEIIGSFHHVINDIERIGDHADNFLEIVERMMNAEIYFSEQGINEVNILYNIILAMYDMTYETFENKKETLLSNISALENRIDDYEREIKDSYVRRITKNESAVDAGPFFYSVISGLERIGDHLTNIAYSIKSPTGDE